MADTIRTTSALLALLADNTSQAISPQDLRDVIVSSQVYGGIAALDKTGTTQAVTSTPSKLTIFDTDMPSSGIVPDSTTDNDLTVPTGGDGDYCFDFAASFSVSNTSASYFQFHLRINDVETGHMVYRSITATTVGSASFHGIVSLAAGDALTIWVETGSASSYNIAVYSMSLSVCRIS